MEVTWLGQAGLYLQMEGIHIVVDPYFSDSVGNKDPKKNGRSHLEIAHSVLIFLSSPRHLRHAIQAFRYRKKKVFFLQHFFFGLP